MNINWKRIPAVLHHIEFEVSGDSDWRPYGLTITPVIEDALQKSGELVKKKKMQDNDIEQVRAYMRQYPQFPMFYNHLCNYYMLTNQWALAQQVTDESLKAHPNYFYNGVMQSSIWMQSQTDCPKMPALMRHWNIVAYAGGRAKFAEHEVIAFYLLAANYHLLADQVEVADMFIYFLEVSGADPNRPNIKALRQKVDVMMSLKKLMNFGKRGKKK